MATNLTKQVKIYLPPETDAELAKLKAMTGQSKSETINLLVVQYLPKILEKAEKKKAKGVLRPRS
jgi:hypothetical protein|tara:strand:- start:7252 stop:7446 length:195 start_codon:yes stop_codon:yes gene_type:complete